MSFRIRHPDADLFWEVTPTSKIYLANGGGGSHYVRDSDLIKNVSTGLYVCRSATEFFESSSIDFPWVFDGQVIKNPQEGAHILYSVAGGSLQPHRVNGYEWAILPESEPVPEAEPVVEAEPVPEAETEDVPVSRASALMEEALNAKAEDEGLPTPENPV